MNTSIGNPPGWKALDVTLARNTEDTYTLISQWSRGMLIITYHGIPLHPWSLHPRFMWSASASNHKNIDYQFHQNKALKCSRQFFFSGISNHPTKCRNKRKFMKLSRRYYPLLGYSRGYLLPIVFKVSLFNCTQWLFTVNQMIMWNEFSKENNRLLRA